MIYFSSFKYLNYKIIYNFDSEHKCVEYNFNSISVLFIFTKRIYLNQDIKICNRSKYKISVISQQQIK